MSVPFQCTSRCRRLGRSREPTIMLMLVFGLAGAYIQRPPLGPPGINPSKPNKWKKCPRCGAAVLPNRDGLCVCPNCSKKFDAADAKNYS
jgi:hypothetical protein